MGFMRGYLVEVWFGFATLLKFGSVLKNKKIYNAVNSNNNCADPFNLKRGKLIEQDEAVEQA